MKTIVKSLLASALLLNSCMTSGQEFSWAKSCNDSGHVAISKVAVDSRGNTYATGYCNGPATIGTTTIVPAPGGTAYCLVKYDSSGNVVWARSGGSAHNNGGNDVCVDAAGNVYVTGFFHNSITFGSTTLIATDTDFTTSDVFVAKYDSSGAPLWARQSTGYGQVYNSALFADGPGNVYVTGQFNDTLVFGTITLSGSGQSFLVKYSASGDVQWANQSQGGGFSDGFGVCADNAGNVYVTGAFGYGESFGTAFLPGIGHSNVFLAKYDHTGNTIWAKQAGSITTSDATKASGICTGSGGNIYITGNTADSITFGTVKLVATGSDLLFITKYDSSGNVAWAEAPSGSASMSSAGAGIVMDNTGALLVTGGYSGTIKFDTTASMTGAGDIFVAKYNTSGSALWAISAGGAGMGGANGIAANGNSISISGTFSSTASFGSSVISDPESYPISFVAHLSDTIARPQTGINNLSHTGNVLVLYPNPADGVLTITAQSPIDQIAIISLVGETVSIHNYHSEEVRIDVAQLPPGVYFVKVNGSIVRKFVKA